MKSNCSKTYKNFWKASVLKSDVANLDRKPVCVGIF